MSLYPTVVCNDCLPHLIDGLHGEVECHELYDRPESGEGGSHADAGKTHFRDRSILDSLVSVFLP